MARQSGGVNLTRANILHDFIIDMEVATHLNFDLMHSAKRFKFKPNTPLAYNLIKSSSLEHTSISAICELAEIL